MVNCVRNEDSIEEWQNKGEALLRAMYDLVCVNLRN